MRRFLLLILCCLPLLPTSAQETDTASDAPYLYWYNDYLNAFIIERADGTDSRIFGENVHPNITSMRQDGGWSSSGQWFAWADYIPLNEFAGTTLPRILNVNGKDELTSIQDIQNATLMIWSPTEDLIFIAELVEEGNESSYALYRFFLIDTAADQIITSFESSLLGLRYGAAWSPDGDSVSFLKDEGTLQIVTRSGELLARPIRAFALRGDYPFYPYTPDGRLIYKSSVHNGIIIEDLANQQVTTISFKEEIQRMYWSPNGNHALLFTSISFQSAWLLNLQTTTLTLILENALFPSNRGYVYSDLPIWSPNGQQVFLCDTDYVCHIFNVATNLLTTLNLPIDAHKPLDWLWYGSNELISEGMFLREENHQLFYEFYRYDLLTNELTPHEIESKIVAIPSERYGVSIGASPIIYNFETNQYFEVRPHSAKNPLAISGGEIYWHPQSDWFITGEYSSVTGSTGDLLRGVIKADGTFRRDIGICKPIHCTNWLPDQVNIEELPPPVLDNPFFPSPDQIISSTNTITSLSWSPDNRLIASGTSLGVIIIEWDTLWDVETGKAIGTIEGTGGTHQLTWQEIKPAQYSPQVKPIPWREVIFASDSETYIAPLPDSQNGRVGIYDAATNALIRELADSDLFTSFSYNGQWIVGSGNSTEVHLWNAETGQLITTLPVFSKAVAFSPDGKWLAVGVSWNIHLYDMAKIREWVASHP